MTRNEIQDRIDHLTVWRRRGQRAPHKPLLVLYALGRLLRGEERLVPYTRVDGDLRKLLIDFGPHRRSIHPEYPFWRLMHDGVWELTNTEHVEARESNTDAKKSELIRYDVHGGFPQGVHDRLKNDRQFIMDLAERLLSAHFPDTLHDDILQAVGIETEHLRSPRPARDPEFREKILRAYAYRCAVCGFDVRLGSTYVALEAAHIKWHQAGGPDTEPNGVALCSLHHKLFDRGAFTITDSLKVLVSERAHGSTGFREWLLDFHGRQLREPQRRSYDPESQYTRWHVREVFRGPSRYDAGGLCR